MVEPDLQVLMVGSDRMTFQDGSNVLERVKNYTSKMKECHSIIFTLKGEGYEFRKVGSLYIYPTNSSTQWHYVFDAYRIGKKIIKDKFFVDSKVVISTQDPFLTGLVGLFLSRISKIPLHVQIHTDYLSKHFSNSIQNIVRKIIASIVIPRAQGLRVVSSVIKDSIKLHFKNLKVEPQVLPVFVDIESMISAYPKRDIRKDFNEFKFIILMASRLTKEKRIDVAIRSMKEVIRQYPHTGLIVCGSGPEKNKLKNLSKDIGLSKNVVFAGWQEDLLSYYKTANIFLLTSEYEGYGMTLIEAGSAGCPIVTTKVGIAKTNLFTDNVNCKICKISDPESVTESILDLLMDNQKRDLFKHKMQDTIKSMAMTREEYADKYIELLNRLASK